MTSPLTDDELREWAARLSVAEIAADSGLSQRRVRTRLDKLGVKAKPGMRMPLADTQEMLAVLARVGSVEATAAHYRVSRQAIYWRLNQQASRRKGVEDGNGDHSNRVTP